MSSETIVYAVESGEYSDYRVDALFSTREKAEAYAAWQNGPPCPDGCQSEDSRVVEYGLDSTTAPKTGRWEIGGTLDKWIADNDGLGDGWWNPDITGKTEATRDKRDGTVWIWARGKDHARALRSGRELARAIKAGTFIVPPEAPHAR